MTVKYAIADDHKLFRKGLRLILADDPQLECTGEAGDGLELLELLKNQPTHVVLLDINMPNMDGIEVLKQIRANYDYIKVVILTMNDNEHFILNLMELGANGYLIKNAEAEEVQMAIHAAHETGYYFTDQVSKIMLNRLVKKNDIQPRFKQEILLNDKEREVLRLICKEHTTAEIGEKIFLSPRTVDGIRATLLEKIGVRNIAGLVIYAIKNGIYEE